MNANYLNKIAIFGQDFAQERLKDEANVTGFENYNTGLISRLIKLYGEGKIESFPIRMKDNSKFDSPDLIMWISPGGTEYEGDKTYSYFSGSRGHRPNGLPALERSDGYKEYHENGKYHRVDGPAMQSSAYYQWYLNGERHRTDGPAMEKKDKSVHGGNSYWLNGESISKENHSLIKNKLFDNVRVRIMVPLSVDWNDVDHEDPEDTPTSPARLSKNNIAVNEETMREPLNVFMEYWGPDEIVANLPNYEDAPLGIYEFESGIKEDFNQYLEALEADITFVDEGSLSLIISKEALEEIRKEVIADASV